MERFSGKPDFTMPVTVSSHDADLFRRLSMRAQLRLQQEAGERQLAEMGLTYRTFYEHGAVFIVTRLSSVQYRAPRFEEKLLLTTWPRNIKGAQLFRCYRFATPEGEPLIDAVSSFSLADAATHRLLRPDLYLELCGITAPERTNGCADPGKLLLPAELAPVGVRPIVYSDLDYNGHVNNTVYADLLTDYMPGGMNGRTLAGFSLQYEREALPGDVLSLSAKEENGNVFFRGEHARGVCFRAVCRFSPEREI